MEVFPQNITTLDGKDVTFQCKAIGAPAPETQWIFNGKCKKHISHILSPMSQF
jgi:hypothetical protein